MDQFAAQLTEQIPRLRRFARALTGERNSADELVQDCLERAWRHAAKWQSGSDLRAWLFKIMHNLFLNQIRNMSRRPPIRSLMGDELSDQRNDPEQALRVDQVNRQVQNLSPEQRSVLMLVVMEGLTYEEVAAVLEIPLGTVMSRLYRAREQMRKLVGGDEPRAALRRVK